LRKSFRERIRRYQIVLPETSLIARRRPASVAGKKGSIPEGTRGNKSCGSL